MVRPRHFDADEAIVVVHLKTREMVDAWKEAPSGEGVEAGVGVATGDKDSCAWIAVFVLPFHRDAMSGVLAGDAEDFGKSLRADFLQADQADPHDGMVLEQFWSESWGKDRADDIGRGSVVEQDSAANDALDCGDFHGGLQRRVRSHQLESKLCLWGLN